MSRPYATRGYVFAKGKVVHLPEVWVRGHSRVSGDDLVTCCGHIIRDADWNEFAEYYNIDMDVDPLPICTRCDQVRVYRIEMFEGMVMKP